MIKVSVIIPYFNSEKTIIRALSSVVNQTYKNFEIVLIDDGSTDDSYNKVEEFKKSLKNISIKNIRQENKGPSAARNLGISLATGEYIAFLDADDEWIDTKLEIQVKFMSENSIDMLGCNYYIVKQKIIKHYFIRKDFERIGFKKLLFKHFFATPCVIVKKEILNLVGGFDECKGFMEDSLLFTKIARNYDCYMISDFLVKTYKNPYGENGLSSKLRFMEKEELHNFKLLRLENKYNKEKINFIIYFLIIAFSIFKYLKRLLVCKLRKIKH